MKLVRKLDPPRADSAFHFANEIRGLGGANLCKDFAHTVQFEKFLDSRVDEYQTETVVAFPVMDAARVLSQAIDEDTMGRVDDDDSLDLKVAYLLVKIWILNRDVKLELKKHTRAKPAVKNPDDMVYGVGNAQPSAEPVAPQPAAASAEDP